MQISNRAIQLLQDQRHQSSDLNRSLLIEFNQSSDKILTLKYRKDWSDVEKITLEVMAIFLKNRELKRISSISIKELESFLRDDNLIPSADNNTLSSFELALEKIKKCLIIETLVHFFPSIEVKNSDLFIEKIKFHQSLITFLNQYYFSESKVKHIMSEHEFIYCQFSDEKSEPLFQAILNNYFEIVHSDLIKVVAVKG